MMFKAIDVWKRLGKGRLVRYRCFQVLPGGGYCVQSADFYDAGQAEEAAAEHERQFLELLREQAPDARSSTYDTLEEAIAAHEGEFGPE